MITWPDIVPTVEEDKPDASSDTAKTQLDALPGVGRGSGGFLDRSYRGETLLEEVEAAMMSMAPFTIPATPMASVTSRIRIGTAAEADQDRGPRCALGKSGVQEDHVGHDRGAQNARCQEDTLRVGEDRHHGMVGDLTPIGRPKNVSMT